MVLIITLEYDKSSCDVIDWLDFYRIDFVKISNRNKVKVEWGYDDIVLVIDEIRYPLSIFQSYWYRRSGLNLTYAKTFNAQIDVLLYVENQKLIEYLNYRLSKIPHISSNLNCDLNKLIVSDMAREIGLKVPKDFIVDSKNELKKLLTSSNESFSSKSISGQAIQVYNGFCSFFYTKRIQNMDISSTKPTFFPSLIQDYIDKKYELRIFFLNEKFYSMAIFSQKDSQTSEDFRNYNNKLPNRTVPYELPTSIKNKIVSLMQILDLNCGSIDMIVTPENEYYFLEVNPIGQFGMVSIPCNYGLEEKIAKTLRNEKRNKEHQKFEKILK